MKAKLEEERIINLIEDVCSWSKNVCPADFIQANNEVLNKIGTFLQVSPSESLLFSVVFANTFLSNSMSIKSLADFFDISTIGFSKYLICINNLVKKRLVRQIQEFQSRRRSMGDYYLEIPQSVVDAIIRNEHPTSRIKIVKSDEEFFSLVVEIINERGDNVTDIKEMHKELRALFDENRNLKCIAKMRHLKLSLIDQLILVILVNKYLTENSNTDIQDLKCITNAGREFSEIKKSILFGTSSLIVNKLIKLEEGFFLSEKILALTDSGLELMLQNHKFLSLNPTKKPDGLVPYTSIIEKQLFYNPKEKKQVEQIIEILKEENYQRVISSLRAKKLPTSLNFMFISSPGNSKTESIKQIALKCQRDIICVDISNIKNLYLGESEKNVRRIFSDFRSYASTCQRSPMLIIDEAQGIMHARNYAKSAVDSTENAIQSIILDELQDPLYETKSNLILFIALNDATGLELAYFRRFIMKIEFYKPNNEVKLQLLKHLLPTTIINHNQLIYLSQFDFSSGAEIENVAKKIEMYSLFNQHSPSFEEIIEMCNDEKIGQINRNNIGYSYHKKSLN